MSGPAGTIFLVDDDPAVLAGLSRLLRAAGFDVLGFASAREFLQAHDPALPGCAVLDLALPDLDGIELQRRLNDRGCGRPIVFLSGRGTIPLSVEAMKAGAVDFLTKPAAEEALLAAIGGALEKDRAQRLQRRQRLQAQERVATLTPRESQILPLIVAGLLNKQIAAELGAAEKTVKVHRARIMRKMGVRSVAELVQAALLARSGAP